MSWCLEAIAMSVGEEVQRLLGLRNYAGLTGLAVENRAVIRHLLSLLDDREGLTRWRAMEGLGRICGELGRQDPAAVEEIVGVLVTPPEGASGGAVAPDAVGEIIKNGPDLYGQFTPRVLSFFEDETHRRGVIWAAGRIGKRNPQLIQDAVPRLIAALGDPDPEIRGMAAWSLGEIGAQDAALELSRLREDYNTAIIYEAGKLWQRTVGAVAMDAVANIRARAEH